MDLIDVEDMYLLFLKWHPKTLKEVPVSWRLYPSFDKFKKQNNQWVWKYE